MMKLSSAVRFALLAGLVFGGDAARAAEGDYFAYVGACTKDKSKGIYVYRFQAGDGKLTFLNTVASRGGGSVAVLPIGEDGKLSEASAFVQHAAAPSRLHAHSINLSPDNRFAIAADLGLDQVLVYRFDPVKGSLTGRLTPTGQVLEHGAPVCVKFVAAD